MLRSLARLFLLLLVFSLFSMPASASGDAEHSAGLKYYKSRNYRSAAKKFEEALAKGNGSPNNYIYMAHSYAAAGELGDAVRVYNQIIKAFKGLPAAALAKRCLQRIDPHGKWQSRIKARVKAKSSSSSSTKKHLVDRIYVVPPTKGHPAVNPETIRIVRQTLLSLPRYIYNVLDAGGTNVYVAPNIIDKWPDAIYAAKPGEERVTLSQESGHCYGRDVYLFERSIDLKTERLTERRSPVKLKEHFIYVLGHAYNDCLGPLSETAEYRELYSQDESELSPIDRYRFSPFLRPNFESAGDVFCAVFATTFGGRKFDKSVLPAFPKLTAFIKTKIGKIYVGGKKPEKLIADSKVKKEEPDEPHKIRKKVAVKAHAKTHAHKTKSASKPFTEFIPKETKIHYLRAVGERLLLRGTIEGKPVHWLLDTGAFETIVPKSLLKNIGVETPPGPPTGVVGSVLGNHLCWDMELNITVGNIRKKEKVKVVDIQEEKQSKYFLLGQPFLRDLHYSIDKTTHYITFNKKNVDSTKHVHKDSFNIPFRMIDGHIVVITRLNGKGLEMIFDTGAPVTLISGADNERLRIPNLGPLFDSANGEVHQATLDTLELGQIKKTNITVLLKPSMSGKSILGHDFFGDKKFVVDNAKNVIRFVH